ncbi:MAG: (Fe-S)-binding protein [Phycisphaeraceae bacterium]
MKLALFVTCLTDAFYPRTGIATVKVLEHLGCDVTFPQAQTCCGQPMFNNGFHHEARKLARHMIDVFEDAACVVTPSGSCAAMVREHYAELLKDDPAHAERAEALAGKTYELVEFLVKVLKVDLRKLGVRWPGKVTYHYSCHLRGLGITDEAGQLMRQIDGLEYVPLPKAEQCCGFGGTFAMKYPQISGEIVRDKVGCIEATGASTCVSNDAGCTMNIAGACRRHEREQGGDGDQKDAGNGNGVQFKSLAEIIAEGLGLMKGDET